MTVASIAELWVLGGVGGDEVHPLFCQRETPRWWLLGVCVWTNEKLGGVVVVLSNILNCEGALLSFLSGHLSVSPVVAIRRYRRWRGADSVVPTRSPPTLVRRAFASRLVRLREQSEPAIKKRKVAEASKPAHLEPDVDVTYLRRHQTRQPFCDAVSM